MARYLCIGYKSDMKTLSPVTSFDQLSVHSFFKGFEFRDLVIGKMNALDGSNASHRMLEGRVRILLDMIEESRLGRYIGMPLSMFAKVLVELDGFVRIDDDQPDTQVEGYLDDLARIQELFNAHRDETEAFLKWKRSQVAA